MTMYKFQDFLPQLPVPKLEETCRQYLATVTPFLSESELIQTKLVVESLLQMEGIKLQKQLEMLAKSTDTNYVHEFYNLWFSQLRDSRATTGCLNYGAVLSPIWNTSESPMKIGAIAIHSLLLFHWKIKYHQLQPDQNIFRRKHQPLCMMQYENLFGISRIPGIQSDRLSRSATAEHIVVIWQNKFYFLKVIKDRKLLSVRQIEAQLEWIMQHTTTFEVALGVLTALPRTQWAIVRSYLASLAPENVCSLSKIDNALFVVCLDDIPKVDLNAMMRIALHGNGRNRWFDKSLQFIITTAGQLATNHDNASADGYTAMRLIGEVVHDIQNWNNTIPTYPIYDEFELPVPLEWYLTREFLEVITDAEETVDSLIAQDEKEVWEFTGFGDNFCRQNNMVSEAIVQLSIQLAYFHLYGELALSYQPVHLRHYQYGRIDGLRVMSSEFVEFVRNFRETKSDEVKIARINRAVRAYLKLLKVVKDGKNIELHLFALENLAHYLGETPQIFQDKTYTEVFLKPTITTSSVSAKLHTEAFGFGMGGISSRYLVCYLIKQDKITFFINSRYEPIAKYITCLEESLLEIGRVISKASRISS